MHARVAYQLILPPKSLNKITLNEYPVTDQIYYFNDPSRGTNLVYYQEARYQNHIIWF